MSRVNGATSKKTRTFVYDVWGPLKLEELGSLDFSKIVPIIENNLQIVLKRTHPPERCRPPFFPEFYGAICSCSLLNYSWRSGAGPQ